MQEIKIGKTLIGPSHPPYLVAELSANHQGSLERMLDLATLAKETGANAVKLQTYTPDTITLDMHESAFVITDPKSPWKGRSLYDLYREACLPLEWHQPIFDYCQSIGIDVFSTPFDETAVDFLEELNVPCYKIASLEIVDLPLIEKVARTGKPLILSTGSANICEIEEAVSAARQVGCDELILLKCTTAYPADAKDANLRTLKHMATSFDTLVGLSDHTLGIGVAIASIPLGACLIEKHFTFSRSEPGVDTSFSMEPEEFRQLVQESKRAWEALGEVLYAPVHAEQGIQSLRPSLYFIEDLPSGTIVQEHHIKTLRPGIGLPPKELSKIIGLTLMSSVKKGTAVHWSLFKEHS